MDNPTPKSRVIHGQIQLPPDAPALTPAYVLVELEDTSRADAPSQVVARQKLVTGTLRSGDLISFRLEVPADALSERNSYSVRVHVDVNGSGKIDSEDYITMQSYPVLTRGHEDAVRVAVRQVRG